MKLYSHLYIFNKYDKCYNIINKNKPKHLIFLYNWTTIIDFLNLFKKTLHYAISLSLKVIFNQISGSCTSVEVSSIDALFEVEDTFVVLHQAAQFLGQLQGHVLQRCGLRPVHHHRLSRLVERCLSKVRTKEQNEGTGVDEDGRFRLNWRFFFHHEFFIDDHLADNAVHCG